MLDILSSFVQSKIGKSKMFSSVFIIGSVNEKKVKSFSNFDDRFLNDAEQRPFNCEPTPTNS